MRKAPITLDLERVGAAAEDVVKPVPKYDPEGTHVSMVEAGGGVPRHRGG